MRGKDRPQWADYAAWTVSAVVIRRYLDRAEADEYVPLAKEFMVRFVPGRYRRELLDILLEGDVLECDWYFRPTANGRTGKSYGYRLGPAHRGARVRPVVLRHPQLLANLRRDRQRERDAVTDPVHVALRRWHDQVEVLPHAPYGEHVLLDRMVDGERRFTVCDQGRVHHNVANLPAQYRQFIRLGGRELVGIDIATSQPLILALTLHKSSPTHIPPPTPHPSPPLSPLVGPCSPTDLSVLLEDCLSGVVYDRIAEETGLSREAVKRRFLAVVYGQPRDMHTRVGEAVRRLYPAAFDRIVDLADELGHGGLARRMQAVESRVMIGRVAGRLVREHPAVPLLTVHDSILVPAEHVELGQRVIAEEWRAEFGVAPTLKESWWTDPQPARPKRKRRAKRRRRDGRPRNIAGNAPDAALSPGGCPR
jgi:hypothetical protein